MRTNSPLRGSKKLLLAGMLALSVVGFSQNPSTRIFEDWNTTSGTQNNMQRSIVRSKSIGGATYYYVCGSTLTSSGTYDIFVQKKNSSGVVLWTQTYNGAGNGNDYGADVQIANSGSVYVCGTYYKNSTDSNNAIILKYNASGTQQWTYVYNGAGSRHDMLAALQLSTAAVVGVGTTYKGSTNLYDMLAVRVDTNGNQVWAQTWDYANLNDVAVNLYNSGTKVYIAGGAQSATTTYKYAVFNVKFSDGTIQGSTTTGGTAFGFDQLTDIQYDLSGNIYLTGGVLDVSSGYNIKTVKLDSSLNILWSQTYSSSGTNTDIGTGLAVDQVGNVIVTGYRTSATTGKDYVTIKYSSGGTQRWVSTFDGGTNEADSATCIVVSPTDTNKIFVSGFSYHMSTKDYWTLKYDGAGNLKWDIGFNHVDDADDRATAIALDTLGNVIVSGQNQLIDGTFEYTTVKYVEKSVTVPQDTIAYTLTNFSFLENRGQVIYDDQSLAPEVKYYTMYKSPEIFFTDTSVSYVYYKNDTSVTNADSAARVDMKFVNGNSDTRIRSLDAKDNYYNFFMPQCPEGIGHVQNYEQLVTLNVWNNVDVLYGSNLMGLKYYFICKPIGGGGSASQIDLYYEGADSVKINGSGELVIYTPFGNIVQPKAAAWQLDATGNYQSLGWQPNYTILGTNEVGFTGFGSYNAGLPVVIAVDWGYKALSPTTDWFTNNVWSTYMEGNSIFDFGMGSTTTTAGNLITTGATMSGTYPVTAGAWDVNIFGQDIYVTKFNLANDLEWSTYIGGYSDEGGYDVIEEASTRILIFGNTSSDNFPMSPPSSAYQNDINTAGEYTYFFFELTPQGDNFIWSTYFGGTDEEFANWGQHMDQDAAGNTYIAGMTKSSTAEGFPITNLTGAFNDASHSGTADGFVAKFSGSKILTWCSYFGGSGYEDLSSMDVDNGELYVTGYTTTTTTNTTCQGSTGGGFPICNGGYYQSANQGGLEAFISRFDATGALVWSTFYGGSGSESDENVLVYAGNIYLVGTTSGASGQSTPNQCSPTTNGDFPLCDPGSGATFNTTISGVSDLFLVQFNSSNQLQWSTFFGGTGNESAMDLAIDGSGNLFIGGYVSGDIASVYHGNFYYDQPTNAATSGNSTDGFIVEVNPARTVTWSTHYGGYSPSVTPFNYEQIADLCVYQSSSLFITGVATTLNFPYRCDDVPSYCYQETDGSKLQSAFCAEFDLTGGVGVPDGSSVSNGFNVFPNPATTQLTVNLNSNIEDGTTFSIYNSVGQVVYTLNLTASDQNRNFSIDIAFLSTGMYIARLESPTEHSAVKFIKE